MIEITFEDFHEHNFDEEGFVLYVLRNGLDDALYVGISRKIFGVAGLPLVVT